MPPERTNATNSAISVGSLAMSDLTNPIFTDETKAREYLEALRWPDGPYCPHCGSVEGIRRLEGKSTRPGLHQCNECRQHFTVTVGTVYERSHIPLHKWLLATHLLSASKKGISAHQLHRMLGITYKSAWFMAHRIREAMKDTNPAPLGGEGKTVEADETFIGRKKRKSKKYGYEHKMKVVSLVERDGGKARSVVVDKLNTKSIAPILRTTASRKSNLVTDEARHYVKVGREFASHESVNHAAKEYVRGDTHTNTIEGFFSIFKRGMKGIYQHCGEQHLQRYLNEFDFRYNNRQITDAERADEALKGIAGKRLTYRRTGNGANQ